MEKGKSTDIAEIQIKSEAFNPAYLPFLNDTTETQIIYGGSSSGKSFFLAERVVYDLLCGERNYLICRKIGDSVGKSVWVEIGNVIRLWGLEDLFTFNKSSRIITCDNGKQALFTGLDDPQKLKSIRAANGSITDIWIEEATETDASDFKELTKRQRGGSNNVPKRMILSFNPILQSHWLYETYFKPIAWSENQKEHRGEKLLILKTTYKDNQFLTQQDIDRLESETDKYYFDVYTLGNWGTLGHAIFQNWTMEDLSAIRNSFDNLRAGLDFGFSSDPAALSVSHYDKTRKTIYFFDELYETGLTNDVLSKRLKDKIGYWNLEEVYDDNGNMCLDESGKPVLERVFLHTETVTCDSAEPKSIAELQGYGIAARPAAKGKDSVLHGIQWLQQQKIVVDTRCLNLRNELQSYHWKEDAGGNATHVPADKDNHLIDATRYAYERDMTGMGGGSRLVAFVR